MLYIQYICRFSLTDMDIHLWSENTLLPLLKLSPFTTLTVNISLAALCGNKKQNKI